MQRIHIDFATIDRYQVLVIMDVHSKWIDAAPLQSATATTTINVLRCFFASFGLPEELVGDNGPPIHITGLVSFFVQIMG